MKINKIIASICFATIGMISTSAYAASSEDFGVTNPACMVSVNDSANTRFINVNYIRVIQLKEKKVLFISMASNYYNGETDGFRITYPNNEAALKALDILSDKINDCQYDAAMKRANKKKS